MRTQLRRWIRSASLVLAASAGLAIPVAAVAQDPAPVQESARERARDVLDADLFDRVDALAREAEGEGLPPEPLYQKALEGAAKGVPADRLVPAVTEYAGRLRHVRSLLGPDAGAAVLVAGVDAVRRGVPGTSLRGLEARERSPVVLVVLADLVESGVPAAEAMRAVRDAVGRQSSDEAMLAIPSSVRRLMRAGRSPRDAMEQVRRALRRGRGGGTLDRPGPPAPPGSEPLTRGRGRRERGGARGP